MKNNLKIIVDTIQFEKSSSKLSRNKKESAFKKFDELQELILASAFLIPTHEQHNKILEISNEMYAAGLGWGYSVLINAIVHFRISEEISQFLEIKEGE